MNKQVSCCFECPFLVQIEKAGRDGPDLYDCKVHTFSDRNVNIFFTSEFCKGLPSDCPIPGNGITISKSNTPKPSIQINEEKLRYKPSNTSTFEEQFHNELYEKLVNLFMSMDKVIAHKSKNSI